MDLRPFADAILPTVRAAYNDMQADDLVEVFFNGEQQDRLQMLQHQLLLHNQDAYTHMIAAAMELERGKIAPAELLDAQKPVIPDAYSLFEYAIIGDDARLRINPSDVQDAAGAANFIASLFDFGSSEAETVVKSMLPVTVRAGNLADPDRLTEILKMAREFNGNIAFVTANPFSDRVMDARRRLAACRRLFEISALFEGMRPDQAVEAIPALLAVFLNPRLQLDALGDELLSTLEGSL